MAGFTQARQQAIIDAELSYNSCPWPWQTSKYDISIQTR